MLLVFAAAASGDARAFDCTQKYCKRMSSCAEAHYKFTVCHDSGLDRDKDGVPCENVCGKTLEIYFGRLRALGISPEAPMMQGEVLQLIPDATAGDALTCAVKRRCGEMLSCEEARFYLKQCGVRTLDGGGNGVPCESLCRGR